MNAILAKRFLLISAVLGGFAISFALAARENNLARTSYLSGDLFVCETGQEAICRISDLDGTNWNGSVQ